jgi:hypothetical protein
LDHHCVELGQRSLGAVSRRRRLLGRGRLLLLWWCWLLLIWYMVCTDAIEQLGRRLLTGKVVRGGGMWELLLLLLGVVVEVVVWRRVVDMLDMACGSVHGLACIGLCRVLSLLQLPSLSSSLLLWL